MNDFMRNLENRKEYLESLDKENKCTVREFEELYMLHKVLGE